MTQPIIDVDAVSKRFRIRHDKSIKERLLNGRRSAAFVEDFWALRDVSMAINAGTSIGLLGPNGSGKSTLLKVIGGIIHPSSGTVTVRGRLAALLELGAGFHPDLTGRENVFLNASLLGMSKRETEKAFDEIVAFSGIENFIDTQVKFYSSGMYVRLAFAVAVHTDPEILLVDEVLAVGDEAFQRKCVRRIREFQRDGRTMVLVSHSPDQISEMCDRAIVLDHGLVVADGKPEVALRRLRAEFERTLEAEREAEKVLAEARGAVRPEAEIKDVVITSGGERFDLLPTGAPIEIEATLVVDELRNWTLAVSLEDPMGRVAWETDTRMTDYQFPDVTGGGRIRIKLPALHAGANQYGVNFIVRDELKEDVVVAPRAATFEVTTDHTSRGLIAATPTFTLETSS